MHTGGWADKLGNRYEGRWAADQLLRLLDGKLQAVRLENVKEDHVDLSLRDFDGISEFHQCKRKIDRNGWTIRELETRGVLDALRAQLSIEKQGRFVFVSNQQPTDLKRLIETTRCCNDLSQFLSAIAGGKDEKAWEQWCKAIGCQDELATALDLLKRTELELRGDEPRDVQRLHEVANYIVVGDPRDIVLRLADYAEQHLGQWIHVDTLRAFIRKETTFQLRELAHCDTIQPAIERRREEFRTSIAPYFVKGQLIPRPETQTLLGSIKGSQKRIHIIHGTAGQGKSCVLFELMSMLEQNAIPYLPVRLDTRIPRDNTRTFGKQLELPESPVRCLLAVAENRTPVLILDQLDALHWSPQHDPSSWTVFLQLMMEVLTSSATIHAVIACRTFDLTHDPSIKAWKNDKDWGLAIEEIPVGDMPDDSVKPIVENHGTSWPRLSRAQRDLLRKPHLLYLWCKLREDSAVDPTFHTPSDLLRHFWNQIRKKLCDRGCQESNVNDAVETLVNYLDRSAKLTAPESMMDDWGAVREGLLSLDVLQRADGQVRFVHQSYYEYYLARLWLKRLRDQQKTVYDWLSENDEQSLLRRGQLRQLLSVLRDDEPTMFLEVVRDILAARKVRYHLQQLTLQQLGSIGDSNQQEVELVREMLQSHIWRDAIATQVLAGRASWVQALDQTGVWKSWLDGVDPWERQTALWLLGTVVEMEGDRVAELLENPANASPPWRAHVWNALPREPDLDSGKVFDLRLRLVRSGNVQRSDFCFTDEFCKRQPRRAIELLEAVLLAEESKEEPTGEPMDREGWPYWIATHTATAVRLAAETEPELTWEKLIHPVVRAIGSHVSSKLWRDERPFVTDTLWSEELYRFDSGHTVALPAILAEAGGIWFHRNPKAVEERIQVLSRSPSRTLQQLAGTMFLNGPDDAADQAVEWLLADEQRFSLAQIGKEQQRSLAKQIIARFAPICSQGAYERLEKSIRRHHPFYELEDAKYRLRCYQGGQRQYSANKYGLAQHSLLGALPVTRRSIEVVNTIGQLQRKYVRTAEEMEADEQPQGGWMSSPVTAHAARLSDKAWLQIITKDPRTVESRRRWFRDHALESSPEMFSRDLRHQAQLQPSRFAALAMKIPLNVHADYWASLLHCLGLTRPPDDKLSDWAPATEEQCRSVLERIGYHPDRDVGVAFCNCVAMRPRCGTTSAVLATLCRYATEHPDPDHDGCVLPQDSKDRLDTEAINTVRGCAAGAIATLLFENRALINQLEPAIRQLAADKVGCVRAAVVGAILPVVNVNRDLAVDLFLAATAETGDAVLRTRYARRLIGYLISSHLDRLKPLIARMVSSLDRLVSEDGASWTTLAYMVKGQCNKEFDECAAGSSNHRKGVAQTLANNADDDTIGSKCCELLAGYFNDDDREVRNAASLARHRDVDWSKKAALLQSFFLSKAFLDDPRAALWMLESFTANLRSLAEPILSACDSMANRTSDGWGDRWDIASAFESLSTMLLRLYGDTHDSDRVLRRECLDRWDAILRHSRLLTTRVLASIDE
jgi:hypothetical protein